MYDVPYILACLILGALTVWLIVQILSKVILKITTTLNAIALEKHYRKITENAIKEASVSEILAIINTFKEAK